jgi:hypothetical protein
VGGVGVDKWNAEVDRRERMGGIAKAVAKPVRARAVPLLPAWKLANSMQWVLCWEDLEVTGPTATWVRETLQNTYSTDYLRKQSALVSFAHRHLMVVLTAKHWLGKVLPLGWRGVGGNRG